MPTFLNTIHIHHTINLSATSTLIESLYDTTSNKCNLDSTIANTIKIVDNPPVQFFHFSHSTKMPN